MMNYRFDRRRRPSPITPEKEQAAMDEGGKEISDKSEYRRRPNATMPEKEKAIIDEGGEAIIDEFEGIRIA
ncbi:hypothetical protein TIFTF001_034087 [Ficus carica]|uniref:Uncharacterized protein n=1 Tax=Ficus carica TaxID=3494 RepID=A0AA88DZB4_FICCA|nr:hypothetical protein TIFTF001_034087 [Ficus carica]